MALINHSTKEITLKIVYYGPGLSGKTTNLQHLHKNMPASTKGKLISLATETDRTLFFDFMPVTSGHIGEFELKFQLYTVPGQVRYNATRKLVLKGADGVVFVADSQRALREQNKESFANMFENLEENEIDPDSIPIVLQFNKRDLDDLLSEDELYADLGSSDYSSVNAVAFRGDGVEETYEIITELIIKRINQKYSLSASAAAAAAASVVASKASTKENAAAMGASGEEFVLERLGMSDTVVSDAPTSTEDALEPFYGMDDRPQAKPKPKEQKRTPKPMETTLRDTVPSALDIDVDELLAGTPSDMNLLEGTGEVDDDYMKRLLDVSLELKNLLPEIANELKANRKFQSELLKVLKDIGKSLNK